jgi:1-acyl-sn-glycerol-3-phosphate acyltransferase
MKFKLADRKNALVYAFWSTVNKVVLRRKFVEIEVEGRENIPQNQGFMLVANHSARWDGLLVYNLINKPSNFLVHPNELKGFQGAVMKSMGAFPASTRFDLQGHIENQLRKGEPIVIFPEGDINRDGQTHSFRSGVARFALNAVRAELNVPMVPVAIHYVDSLKKVKITVGAPIAAEDYADEFRRESGAAVRALASRLQREVAHMRYEMGAKQEAVHLFGTSPNHNWAQPA